MIGTERLELVPATPSSVHAALDASAALEAALDASVPPTWPRSISIVRMVAGSRPRRPRPRCAAGSRTSWRRASGAPGIRRIRDWLTGFGVEDVRLEPVTVTRWMTVEGASSVEVCRPECDGSLKLTVFPTLAVAAPRTIDAGPV